MKLKPITLDFETYYDTEYSLSKMSFIEYIKDPRFEVISVAVKIGDTPTRMVFEHKNVGEYLRTLPWDTAIAVAHNGNEFDFPLLAWVFDCHPKMFFDTLAMSRAKHQSEVGGSLSKLSDAYGLPPKESDVLVKMKGKRFVDLGVEDLRDLARYNTRDTDNCYELFKIFRQPDMEGADDLRDSVKIAHAHQREMRLSDMTARMACYPQLLCDADLLDNTLAQADKAHDEMLDSVADLLGEPTREDAQKQLRSNNKFAEILNAFGVDPPKKISPTTNKETWAFAKTDEAFTNLQTHDNESVQLLVSARLGTRSTLLQTRLAKMSACAKAMGGAMPVPLAYHSATTGRWGGRVWNPQNLPRIPRDKTGNIVPKLTNALRQSLVAPPGHKVVVSDLSGIELRVNHYLWNVESSMALYAADPEADLYRAFAATMYGVPESAVTKEQRQLAKVAQLGLGFGAGAMTFRRVAKLMGGIDLTTNEAREVVTKWRDAYWRIVQGWTRCMTALAAMHMGADIEADSRGLCKTARDKVLLPSGRWLYYPNLRKTRGVDGKLQFQYGNGQRTSYIYGGLFCENLVQAIARDVVAEQALKIEQATGYRPCHTVHDELVFVAPDGRAQRLLDQVNAILRTPPTWLPGIVLWSEGDIAASYGEAK